ncbi:hypothetical protein [Haematobacter genomosp. 1]|uniref:hypothetical protein n=1 Tax=Haematobacter genomosp. 1 TaxID=366618 RepID=UPI00117B64E0|nr:hypothetical protein [Haematobacter genomosp. 1]
MRCYYVFVHGHLSWSAEPRSEETPRPQGFYCHRYIFAANGQRAAQIALERVDCHFNKSFDWIRKNEAALRLHVEEVSPASLFNLFKRDNRGHVFYGQA